MIGFPFIWQLLCNAQTGEGPGWITPHISSQETPSEPVRPRQGKHTAEKEKPNVPNKHSEAHIGYPEPFVLLRNIKKMIYLRTERRRLYCSDCTSVGFICLFSLCSLHPAPLQCENYWLMASSTRAGWKQFELKGCLYLAAHIRLGSSQRRQILTTYKQEG